MKVGDLVSVLYETRRYYIVLEKLPRGMMDPYGEQMYKLLGLKDGLERDVRYSEIRLVNSTENR